MYGKQHAPIGEKSHMKMSHANSVEGVLHSGTLSRAFRTFLCVCVRACVKDHEHVHM